MLNLDQPSFSELNDLPVLAPAAIQEQAIAILEDLKNSSISQRSMEQLIEGLEEFKQQWQRVFEKFGYHYRGELAYRDLVTQFGETVVPLANPWLLSGKGKQAINRILSLLSSPNPVSLPLRKQLLIAKRRLKTQLEADENPDFPIPAFEKPIFIVSAPRAGSSLLFETLAQFPDLWTIGDESHEIIEGIPALHPAARNFSSNRLSESDVTSDIPSILCRRFAQQLQNRNGVSYLQIPELERPEKVRFLEKTPKNALRIPFLRAIFPDALFIYLYRDPRENISSLLEGWRSQRFVSYKPLPGWPYRQWSFLLVPGWSALQEASVVEIAAYQWKMANSYIVEDLKAIPPSSCCLVDYRDLVENPQKTINNIAKFAQLDQDEQVNRILSQPLPIAQRTLSAPSHQKWRKNERELATVLPGLENFEKILFNYYSKN
jgi:hypothetical protein